MAPFKHRLPDGKELFDILVVGVIEAWKRKTILGFSHVVGHEGMHRFIRANGWHCDDKQWELLDSCLRLCESCQGSHGGLFDRITERARAEGVIEFADLLRSHGVGLTEESQGVFALHTKPTPRSPRWSYLPRRIEAHR